MEEDALVVVVGLFLAFWLACFLEQWEYDGVRVASSLESFIELL